jgi:pimeloyl-ACP methyl ester carboxylesterase
MKLYSFAAAALLAFAFVDVDGIKVFYREAGPATAPVLLLLHGFPTSSHMYLP